MLKRLAAVDPEAAACPEWPLWVLVSRDPLSLDEVQVLMAMLSEPVRRWLVAFRKGRLVRVEVGSYGAAPWLASERSLDGLVGLVALMREAEIDGNVGRYFDAYFRLDLFEPVLRDHPGFKDLAQEMLDFLHARFKSPSYVVPGAWFLWDTGRALKREPVRVDGGGLDQQTAVALYWAEQRGETLDDVIRAMHRPERIAPEPGFRGGWRRLVGRVLGWPFRTKDRKLRALVEQVIESSRTR